MNIGRVRKPKNRYLQSETWAFLPKEQFRSCSKFSSMLDWMHQAGRQWVSEWVGEWVSDWLIEALENLLKIFNFWDSFKTLWKFIDSTLNHFEDTSGLVYVCLTNTIKWRWMISEDMLGWFFANHAHHPPLSLLYNTNVLYDLRNRFTMNVYVQYRSHNSI